VSTINDKLRALAARWAGVPAREMANFQMYVTELAEALDVPRPQPSGSGYEFEYAVSAIDRASGRDTAQRMDLYHRGHFVMEAKHVDARRPNELVLRAAYQQARSYAYDLRDDLPPFIMVMDVGRRLMVWRLRGARYEDWTIPLRTIDLTRLGEKDEDSDFLRRLWLDPDSLRTERVAAAVTRQVADRLAKLAASLEQRGLGQERVARFLIRCVFTMFAEDVDLLSGHPFESALKTFVPGGGGIIV
jgi:hypothetical protein